MVGDICYHVVRTTVRIKATDRPFSLLGVGAAGAHPRKKARSKKALARACGPRSRLLSWCRTAPAPPPPHRECASLTGTDPDAVLGSVVPSASGVLRNNSSDCRRFGNSQSTVATRGFAEQGVCGLFFERVTRDSTVGTQVAPSLPAGRAPAARPALPVDSLASGDHVVWFASAAAVRSRCGCGHGAGVVAVRSGTTIVDASAPQGGALALFDRAFFLGVGADGAHPKE